VTFELEAQKQNPAKCEVIRSSQYSTLKTSTPGSSKSQSLTRLNGLAVDQTVSSSKAPKHPVIFHFAPARQLCSIQQVHRLNFKLAEGARFIEELIADQLCQIVTVIAPIQTLRLGFL
jgi:hypothetical protein